MKQKNIGTQCAHKKLGILGSALMLCMSLLGSKATAQIATYTGTAGTSTAIIYVANETGTILQKTGFGSNSPCGSGGLSGLTNNGVTTFATANAHIYFQILPNSGYQLNVTGITAKFRRSGSGLTKVRYAYSLDGGATWTDDGVDHAPDNTSCGGGTTVSSWGGGTLPLGITSTTNGIIIAMYPYAPISSGGVIQVNQITVNGSVAVAGACTGTPAGGTVAASPSAVCNSGTSVLTLSGATGGSGISYQWQSAPSLAGPYTNISGETNLTYNASVAATTYYHAVTTCSSFGSSNSTNASVTVNPSPSAITGTTTVAQGTTSALSDVDAGGTWTTSDPFTATVNASTGVVTGVASGAATIVYTLPTGCSTSTAVSVPSVAFTSGNLLVLTANGVSSASTSVTIREYNRNTPNQPVPVSQDGIPSVGTGHTTISGSAASEGHLALDAEWTHVTFAGYDATTGVAGIATAPSINRVVYSVDQTSTNTEVANDAQTTTFATGNIRSAVASGSNYYTTGTSSTAGTAGVQLAGATTSSQISATTLNTRVANIFNGQLYYTTASTLGGPIGLYAVGTGIPTTITTSTNVIAVDTNASPYGFSVSPDGNTAYIADDRSFVGKSIYKYTRTGGVWSLAYRLADSVGARCIAVDYSTVPFATIYATTASGSATTRDTLIKIVDSNASATHIVLATADSGTNFRGVSFVPECNAKMYVIGKDTMCVGDSTTLVIYGNPGATVSYTIDGGSPIFVTLNASGTDTIRTGALSASVFYAMNDITTSTCSAVALSGSVLVTVNDVPGVDDIATDFGTAVCVGSTLVLSDDVDGGVWSSSDNTMATVDGTGLVTGVASGMPTISYTVTNNCGSTTVTVGITVDTVVVLDTISGPVTVAAGHTITLADATAGGSWSSSDDGVATVDASGNVTGVTPGDVTITYTYTNSCGTSFVTYSVKVTAQKTASTLNTSVINNGNDQVSLYPNPANTTLYINATEDVNVSILSMDGKVMIEQANAKSINVSSLADGMYIIKVYNNANVLIKNAKFTKN